MERKGWEIFSKNAALKTIPTYHGMKNDKLTLEQALIAKCGRGWCSEFFLNFSQNFRKIFMAKMTKFNKNISKRDFLDNFNLAKVYYLDFLNTQRMIYNSLAKVRSKN